MDLLDVPVDIATALLCWALLAPVLIVALRAVRDGFLRGALQQHAYLAGVAGIALLWTLQARPYGETGLGMLGAALFVLLFGAARGILGLLAALALHHLLAGADWHGIALSGLLFSVLPALITAGLQRTLERFLPKHLFVFIIGNGLFVTLAATAVTSLALLLLSAALAGDPEQLAALGDRIGYALLLAWGEALVSGMLFAALVIFTPALVLTYRQDSYLPPRRGVG